MTFWQRLKLRFGKRPPVIPTMYGAPVPEWARKQAAENMKRDASKRHDVEMLIGKQLARERYPEAFEDDDAD